MKVISIVGARPNFVKIAPLIEEMKKHEDIENLLVHTGQHYDFEMSRIFFQDLDIPEPDINLEVGSGTNSEQTAKILKGFENVLKNNRPDIVIVVGDCNSTLACALCSAYNKIPVAHVEAGLRSFNREMPEEINRILTDHISSLLFATERSAIKNLLNEGMEKNKIFFVGNVMIDSLVKNMEKIDSSNVLNKLNLKGERYCVMTIHRPSNVDDRKRLISIIKAIEKISNKIKIVWPVHPRTRKMLNKFGLEVKQENIVITNPLGYIDFLSLVKNSLFVITDSGGIQEETTFLGIPCVTLRKETERPVTAEIGTNIVVGESLKSLVEHCGKIINEREVKGKIPELWDGNSAKRIIEIIKKTGH